MGNFCYLLHWFALKVDLSPCSGPKILNLDKSSVAPLTLLLSIMGIVVPGTQAPMGAVCFLLSKIVLTRVILATL